LKIDALQDVPFTFYDEVVSIILEQPWAAAQSVWRELTRNERIKFAALEHQRLALQHKNVICIVLDRGAKVQLSFYFFDYVTGEKHW